MIRFLGSAHTLDVYCGGKHSFPLGDVSITTPVELSLYFSALSCCCSNFLFLFFFFVFFISYLAQGSIKVHRLGGPASTFTDWGEHWGWL